jgi:hypothetical protein
VSPVAPLIPVLRWDDGSVLYRTNTGMVGLRSMEIIEFCLYWDRASTASYEIRAISTKAHGPYLSRSFHGILGPDGWPAGAFLRNTCTTPSSWMDRIRMRAQARDIALALRLVGRSIHPDRSRTLGAHGLTVRDVGGDTPSALVEGPVEAWAVIADWCGTALPDMPSTGWNLVIDDEIWALLDQPGPALMPWDRLVDLLDEMGSSCLIRQSSDDGLFIG